PDVTRNVQLQARGFFERLVHPISGPNLYAGLPVRLERGPSRWNRTPPPTFGQHNREVLLGELAVDPRDWERYCQAGIVGETPNLGSPPARILPRSVRWPPVVPSLSLAAAARSEKRWRGCSVL